MSFYFAGTSGYGAGCGYRSGICPPNAASRGPLSTHKYFRHDSSYQTIKPQTPFSTGGGRDRFANVTLA